MNEAIEVSQASAPPACCIYPEEPALYDAVWPWGETEHVSAKGLVVIQQRAKSLKRQPTIITRADAPKPVVSRDERARLQAEVLVRDAELTEVRERGVELAQKNVALTREVQRLTVLNRELERQLKDVKEDYHALGNEMNEVRERLAADQDELERLRLVVAAMEPKDGEPSASG